MTLFPESEKNEVNIYTCPKCNCLYLRQSGSSMMSCSVMHGPGSCCHYGDKSLPLEVLKRVREIVDRTYE